MALSLQILIIELSILLILSTFLGYLLISRKELILSAEGRRVVMENLDSVKKGVVVSVASMLVFLVAETGEIVSELLSERVDVEFYGNIHFYGELAHLFILVFGLLFFIAVLLKVGEKSGSYTG